MMSFTCGKYGTWLHNRNGLVYMIMLFETPQITDDINRYLMCMLRPYSRFEYSFNCISVFSVSRTL